MVALKSLDDAVVTQGVLESAIGDGDFGLTNGFNSKFIGQVTPRHAVLVEVEVIAESTL